MHEIRRVLLADLDAMFALCQQAGFNQWSERQLRDAIGSDIVWIASGQERLLAFAIFSRVLDEAELHNVVVLPMMQKQGLGFHLLDHALQELGHEQVRKCLLEVGVSNTPAIRLYEKLGFARIATRKNYYSRPQGREDALIMQLDLALGEDRT